jgi:uncharacterized NAD(P)/FAD-binding protein YdhS
VTIVGVGPRGLSVLERMAELAHVQPPATAIEVHMVDPGECGQGVHDGRQPDHLLINTVASQITMFAPESFVGGMGGTSLVDWAKAAGYRRFGNRFCPVGDGSGAEITDHDHLPRKLLGEYLTWVYEQVAAALPASIRLIHHRARVADLIEDIPGQFTVKLDNGYSFESDYVVLTTGHGQRRPTQDDLGFKAFVRGNARKDPRLDYFPGAYPVARLSRISSEATVAVQGLGLTAHDVISELTTGRGGKFVSEHGRLRYQRSGREPRLLLFSRNCLPFASRGVNQKGLTGCHQARFCTVEAIQRLREKAIATRASSKLDFKQEVLPLLMKEMGYAYRIAREGKPIDPDSYQLSDVEAAALQEIFYPLEGKRFRSMTEYRQFFLDHIRADLEQAEQGNRSSAVKAATDVLRDTRESLRMAIEYGGSSPDSHRYFVHELVPLMNRVAFGPPKQRNIEFLALWEAGVVDIAGGPGARVVADSERAKFRIEGCFLEGTSTDYAEVLVIARLDDFSPRTDDSPLMARLLDRGMCRPYMNGDFHPGGIDIDHELHPIDASARPNPAMWAIGFLVEGPHFYMHDLPRTMLPSRVTKDAQMCVEQLFGSIARRAKLEASAAAPRGETLQRHAETNYPLELR